MPGPMRMAVFDRDCRLSTSAAHGHVRVCDPARRKLADRVPLPGARPSGLVWSPDAALLSLGYEDQLRVEVLAAGDLHSVMLPDPAGLTGEGLPAVGWPADNGGGVQLYAGYTRLAGAPPQAAATVRDVAVQRGEAAPELPMRHEFMVMPLLLCWLCRAAASPNAAAHPGWGRITQEGGLGFAPRPPGADFRTTGLGLAATGAGTKLRITLRTSEAPIVCDAVDGRLESGGDGTGIRTLVKQAALFIQARTRRWLLWTPEGLFHHAPNGGQDLVGVLLNRGRAQNTEWASFQQAYRALYAPRAVHQHIAGDQAPAQARMGQLGEVRGRIGRLPPTPWWRRTTLTFSRDEQTFPAEATALSLGFTATDPGLRLGPLDVLVNDRIAALEAPGESKIEVPLDPDINQIVTRPYAEDWVLFAAGPMLALRRPGEPEPRPMPGACSSWQMVSTTTPTPS